ncbi:MAG: Gfo/Idh/MocA family oxidoreductase, partial [bacterium]|nr:Gfo/Idh/MocA family oxidoreductase [bacterium]
MWTMPDTKPVSRRTLLSKTAAASAGAFAILKPQHARSADKLKAGIIGCGGRGTAAVHNLLSGNRNVDLVAMGDVFEDKLERSLSRLREGSGRFAGVQDQLKVEPDHHFVGFDSYEKVLASDIDIVLLTTPPGYRPQHFEAAVKAGKHIFAEKPFATDPVGVRRVMAAAATAKQQGLTVMSGAQKRSHKATLEAVDRIRNGEIGEVVAAYIHYLSGPVIKTEGRDPQWGDMEWQQRNWYSFVWICGDQIVEQHFHNIDLMNFLFRMHPESVVASGGAAWRPRETLYGNIYDHMHSDFVYPNGVHLISHCRQYPKGSYRSRGELVVGTKGSIQIPELRQPGEFNPQVQ